MSNSVTNLYVTAFGHDLKLEPLKQTMVQQLPLHHHHLGPIFSISLLKIHLVIHHSRPILLLKLLNLNTMHIRVLNYPNQMVLMPTQSLTLDLGTHFLLYHTLHMLPMTPNLSLLTPTFCHKSHLLNNWKLIFLLAFFLLHRYLR